MKRCLSAVGLVLALCILAGSSASRADTPWSEASTTGFKTVEHYELSLDARFGMATAPFFTPAFPRVRAHGFVLQAAAAYRLRESMLLALRMPMAMLSVAQPAGSYVDVYTWGNPKLSFQHRAEIWHARRFTMFGVADGSLALPFAQHGPEGSLLGLRALQVASALDAFRTQELYASGVLPLSGSYGILLERPRLGLEANLKVPLFFRFSRAGLPSDSDARTFALAPVLHTGARFTATRWLELSLAADTVFNARAPVQSERSTPSTQFSLAPSLSFLLPHSLTLAANVVLPIAGPLGGQAGAGGIQLSFAPGRSPAK